MQFYGTVVEQTVITRSTPGVTKLKAVGRLADWIHREEKFEVGTEVVLFRSGEVGIAGKVYERGSRIEHRFANGFFLREEGEPLLFFRTNDPSDTRMWTFNFFGPGYAWCELLRCN